MKPSFMRLFCLSNSSRDQDSEKIAAAPQEVAAIIQGN